VTVDWDDTSVDSVFDLDAINAVDNANGTVTADLIVGDVFPSISGDSAVLTVTAVDASTGNVSFSIAAHQFATGGLFDVRFTVEDDDTGIASTGTQAWVGGVRVDPAKGELQVIGTSSNDHVTINQQGNGKLKVHADFLRTGNFVTFDSEDIEQIIAYLCEGDDHLTIAGNVDIPAIIHGGNGDDHINAGGGPSVLVGNAGADYLNGGNGRDILIGGIGQDRLVGGGDDDVLIGGSTNADDDDDLLMAALAAWTSSDDYDDRVDALDALLTVQDDEEEDLLTGSSGRDLFYDGLLDILTDVKTKKDPELVL